MQKHTFALATVAALSLASAAHAQSAVQLYGVVDLSLAKVSGKSLKLGGAAPLTNGSSRIGYRGTEDLGGGMKASFNLEAQIDPTSGATQTAMFSRAANLSLSGGFGAVKLGRTLTPSYGGFRAWDLSGAANYNVVSSQFKFAGLDSRNSSEISYSSPSFNGLSFSLGHILKADNKGVAKNDLNVIYKSGNLSAGLSYNHLSGGSSNQALGASYQFGGVRVAASLHDVVSAGKGKGFTLGASTQVGPVALLIDWARDTEAHDSDLLLDARYPLSKRTMVYAAHIRNGKGKAATDVNSTVLGIRHNF
ncbi:porin [Hydrogenophaga sp.]|uniref:porin n=1 Tax=Hydrogenophaga sp. TaxID=1904254 RepID=UPI00286E9D62|nr:porin [Hydrogenophaga sp.]